MRKSIYFVIVALVLSSCQQQQKRSEQTITQENEVVDTVEVDTTEMDCVDTENNVENTSINSESVGNARINRECFGAKDGYFDDLNKYCNKKDEASVRECVAAGIFTVLQPCSCTIVDKGFGKKKVRVNGDEWWVASEFVD